MHKAKRLRRVAQPDLASKIIIDGPSVYEVGIGGEPLRYLSPDPAFEAECAMIDKMMSELDRMLAQSTLRRPA